MQLRLSHGLLRMISYVGRRWLKESTHPPYHARLDPSQFLALHTLVIVPLLFASRSRVIYYCFRIFILDYLLKPGLVSRLVSRLSLFTL